MLDYNLFGDRITGYARVISGMVRSYIINNEYTIELVDLSDGRVQFRFERMTVLIPRNG